MVSIQESEHVSRYSGPSGHVSDQGGRTLVLHLDRGDTLDLYCDNCSAYISSTTFCVSLSQFDVVQAGPDCGLDCHMDCFLDWNILL